MHSSAAPGLVQRGFSSSPRLRISASLPSLKDPLGSAFKTRRNGTGKAPCSAAPPGGARGRHSAAKAEPRLVLDALRCIAMHCFALHCIALSCIALRCTARRCTGRAEPRCPLAPVRAFNDGENRALHLRAHRTAWHGRGLAGAARSARRWGRRGAAAPPHPRPPLGLQSRGPRRRRCRRGAAMAAGPAGREGGRGAGTGAARGGCRES